MMKKDYISLFKRQIIILVVMAGVMQAGNISQVTYFKTWGKVPRVIPSTDPSGICYAPNLNSLLIADSEINELNVWDNTNVFEVNFAGTVLKDTLKNQHTQLSFQEPTGICFNPNDGYYYFTNDVRQRVYQYSLSAGWLHKLQWWDLDFTGVGGPNITDPEGITCDPNTGKLYIINGTDVAGPGPLIVEISISGATLTYVTSYSVSAQATDPEGIGYFDAVNHLFIISASDSKIFEYDMSGNYVNQYSLSGFTPAIIAPQGLGFGPSSQNASWTSLYIADGGLDNDDNPPGDTTGYGFKDGVIYEARFPDLPLPVALTSFEVNYIGSAVRVDWTTASEINNSYWIVERSANDGEFFSEVGRVNGNGSMAAGGDYSFVDESIEIGKHYLYRLLNVDISGEFTIHNSVRITIPVVNEFALHQNYPNPFNPVTTLSFSTPLSAKIDLLIYNSLGQKIKHLFHGTKAAGTYRFEWNGRNEYGEAVPSGLYIYSIQAHMDDGNVRKTARQMMLLR